MRNYTQLFAAQFGTPPGAVYQIYTTAEEAYSFGADAVLPFYMTMDKTLLNYLVNLAFPQFMDNGGGGAPNFGFEWLKTQIGLVFQGGPGNTPRDGWTGDGGRVFKPPPSEKRGKGTKIVPPESLLQSLENLVGLMIRAGFKNTPGGLIARAVAVILALIKGQKVDGKAVGILINEIIGALSN